MQEQIDLVVVAEEKRKAGGLSLSVVFSLVAHVALIVWFVTSYKPTPAQRDVPMARFVELMQQQPQEFTEAPGPEVATAPLNAPLSDRNRKASMPEPTGPNPTTRPGDGSIRGSDLAGEITLDTGDGSITARVDYLQDTGFHAKAGVMIRQSLAGL